MRRVDAKTGELLMPWRRFPSQSAAVRAFNHEISGHKISAGMISMLVNGVKPQHNGFEGRLCGDRDGGDDDDDDDGAGSRPHPSPPFYSAMVTKPVFAPQQRIEAVASASFPRAEAGGGALRPRRYDHGGAASITVEVPREAYYSRVGILQIR